MDFGPTSLKTLVGVTGSPTSHYKNKETLENKGSRTQKREKGTIASLRQGKHVARESHRRLAMSDEEACHRKMAHAPSHVGVWGIG